jgi:hypothetical protein
MSGVATTPITLVATETGVQRWSAVNTTIAVKS